MKFFAQMSLCAASVLAFGVIGTRDTIPPRVFRITGQTQFLVAVKIEPGVRMIDTWRGYGWGYMRGYPAIDEGGGYAVLAIPETTQVAVAYRTDRVIRDVPPKEPLFVGKPEDMPTRDRCDLAWMKCGKRRSVR